MPRKLCDPAMGQAEYEECLERRRQRRARASDTDPVDRSAEWETYGDFEEDNDD